MGMVIRSSASDRFAAYLGELTKVIGHADRVVPLRDYCCGLLATEGRRSVEPMAAVTAPAHVSAQHQKLLHFVANATWSDEQMLAKVRELVVPSIARHGRSKLGSSTIRLFPSRVHIRWGCIISIAGSSASRPIVRWW